MKAKTLIALSLSLCVTLSVSADEGMWMLGNLDKPTRKSMKELGLQLSASQLYNPRKASLKDAIVSFGGFCSGVVVSEDGLVLTNHHCGFNSVQQHSSVEHNYLQDGFTAHTRDEELPNPELYVRFLIRTEDVTKRVLRAVTPQMDESTREQTIDSIARVISEEVSRKDDTLVGIVDAFYAGNEFWLSIYRDYTDVRLVFAPPSSVGKFGWDTDNWVWPRHTGDFSVFRIYADAHNQPADYAPDNVPYHPKYVAPVSLAGYKEGDFCMTIGYPGSTERYLSSFGIEEMMTGSNQAQIDVRGVKQAIWKQAMDANDSIRLKYASKYDESSNYWKNSIGMNRAIRKLHILEKKRAMEESIRNWIRQTPAERARLLPLFTDLELAYKNRRTTNRAQAYFTEAFFYAPELPQLALGILNLDLGADEQTIGINVNNIMKQYADLDLDLDKQVFTAILKEYRSQVDADYLPDFYHAIDTLYQGDDRLFIDSLYARSEFTTPRALHRILEQDTTFNIGNDPIIGVAFDLLTTYFDMNNRQHTPNDHVTQGERQLNSAIRRMYAARNFYPDANSTMRLSFGTVASYTPFDGAEYNYFTTARGILEKNRAYTGDRDYYLQPELLSLLASNEASNLPVCFITNNDITGGNSGSAMFNARGELLGLAFDGNWEAMSSDIEYDAARQRCIGVDMRYVLFIMEKYGKAHHLIEEMRVHQ
ncbi:MAG: S46 family peptidase [Prevotellaceae bacterium]|jgi:hypothetical protein|nr:S46 family peptidase [Prevotellaceae bacterium]